MTRIITFYNKHLEALIRRMLNKPDGAITNTDLSKITELECSDFDIYAEDIEVLEELSGLRSLSINTFTHLDYLKNMRDLEKLDIEVYNYEIFDCEKLAHMKKLKNLAISGGTISSMKIINTDVLIGMKELTELAFHEFGEVDLRFLEFLPNLKQFYCGYADQVYSVETIGTMKQLKELILVDIKVKDLDFLKTLNDDLALDLCCVGLPEGYDISLLNEFRRFACCDICEMFIGNVQSSFIIQKERKE